MSRLVFRNSTNLQGPIDKKWKEFYMNQFLKDTKSQALSKEFPVAFLKLINYFWKMKGPYYSVKTKGVALVLTITSAWPSKWTKKAHLIWGNWEEMLQDPFTNYMMEVNSQGKTWTESTGEQQWGGLNMRTTSWVWTDRESCLLWLHQRRQSRTWMATNSLKMKIFQQCSLLL